MIHVILLFSHSFTQSIASHSFSLRIVMMLVATLIRH